jgi:hypothetical protein
MNFTVQKSGNFKIIYTSLRLRFITSPKHGTGQVYYRNSKASLDFSFVLQAYSDGDISRYPSIAAEVHNSRAASNLSNSDKQAWKF